LLTARPTGTLPLSVLVHCIPPLGRFAPRAGFVILRQTFVHGCQNHGLCDQLRFGFGVSTSRLRPSQRGIDGFYEIVRVISRGLVSIAEVHAIVARAQQAQRESEVSRSWLPGVSWLCEIVIAEAAAVRIAS
jgi:hypothetical protein